MRPTGDPLLRGRYTTKRDGGLTYEFEGFWVHDNGGIIWRGSVRLDGKVKGRPHGEIRDAHNLKHEFQVNDAVAELITIAIEYLVQVEA